MGCSSSQAATIRRQPYKEYRDPDTTTSYVNDRGEPDGEEKDGSPMKDNQKGTLNCGWAVLYYVVSSGNRSSNSFNINMIKTAYFDRIAIFTHA